MRGYGMRVQQQQVVVEQQSRSGSLLFIDLISTSPYTFGLQALGLGTLKQSLLLNLGPAESFFDQVGVAGGGSYFATVQHPGAPIDRFVPAACDQPCASGTCCADPKSKDPKVGCCFAVSDCSELNSGRGVWEETLMHLPRAVQMVALSATLREPESFLNWISTTRGRPAELVRRFDRHVPLHVVPGVGLPAGHPSYPISVSLGMAKAGGI